MESQNPNVFSNQEQTIDLKSSQDRFRVVVDHIKEVIFQTDALPPQIQNLMSQGVQDYLTKPLDVSKLLALTDRFMS